MKILRPLKKYSSFRRIALAQWRPASDPVIHGEIWLDVTKTRHALERLRDETGASVSYAALVGHAVARALGEMPSINAKVIGRRIFLKDTADIYFQVDIGEGADLTGALVSRANELTLSELAQTLTARAGVIRRGEDVQYEKTQKRGFFGRAPVGLLAFALGLISAAIYRLGLPSSWFGADDPDPFGSAMVSNVGRFDVDVAYAPLVPWTRVPYVFLVGRARDKAMVIDGEIQIRTMLPVGATIDHRVIDGAMIGQLARRLRKYVEDPESEA
jgi:pyruvate dehydrogenase E2 component (dihydrolipoamide acetyltransferase)